MHVRYLTLLAFAVVLSCGTRPNRINAAKPDADDPLRVVRVWVKEDARMPKEDVLRGCREWRMKNVLCLEVDDRDDADIRVTADDGQCVERDAKTGAVTRRILAWAYPNGDVTMMAKCMTKTPEGTFQAHQLAGVATHEVGHELGIWDHVPETCDGEKVLVHAGTGKKICGSAVMNPAYDPKVVVVTVIDGLAYDAADPSRVPETGSAERSAVCVYARYGP
ncbi:MAG: hypothetical protein QY323_05965 [Patescibacteria group bacterium]|nr:MAG: hypothetical protein QY323_05965 [Patescibacteria group bacterium]